MANNSFDSTQRKLVYIWMTRTKERPSKLKKMFSPSMDLHFLSMPILILSFLFLFIVVQLRKPKSKTKTIPGPKPLPIIGNLHNLAGKSLPHRAFRDMAAEYGPLLYLKLGQVPFVVISSADVAKEVMKTQDITFANRPPGIPQEILSYGYKNLAFSPYGEYWRQMKKICTVELLSMRRVQSFHIIRVEENVNQSRWIASNDGSPVNLSEKVYQSGYDITTRAALGKKSPERAAFIEAAKEGVRMAAGFSIADLYPSFRFLGVLTAIRPRLEKMHRELDKILQGIIDEHRAPKKTEADSDSTQKTEDLADILLHYQQDGEGLSVTNIKAVLLDIFIGGSDTSAATVDWAMSEMMRNPSTMQKAQDEVRQVFDEKGYVDEADFHKLSYVKLVIKETLRLHPPAPFLIPRENSEKCEISGYEIPSKTRIIINAWAIARDPKYWTNPDSFVPERFVDNSVDYKGNHFEYIPFGSGRRICPGMSFGLANVEYPLAMFLYHFDWALPKGIKSEEMDMEEEFGATVIRKNSLILVPTVKRPVNYEAETNI